MVSERPNQRIDSLLFFETKYAPGTAKTTANDIAVNETRKPHDVAPRSKKELPITAI